MSIAKAANMALSFILELCLLAALGYWGFKTGAGLPQQILLGIGVPAAVAVIWGLLLAPASKRRLRGMANYLLKFVLFGAGTLALYFAGQPLLAMLLGSAFVLNIALAITWKQDRMSTSNSF